MDGDFIVSYRTDTNRYYPQLPYRAFLAVYRTKRKLGPLPNDDQIELRPRYSTVNAYINCGRWVVDCKVCRSAVVVDLEDLVFNCPICRGENRWSRIVLPQRRTEIERILLNRPGYRDAAPSRNWTTESISVLRAENRANGDPD